MFATTASLSSLHLFSTDNDKYISCLLYYLFRDYNVYLVEIKFLSSSTWSLYISISLKKYYVRVPTNPNRRYVSNCVQMKRYVIYICRFNN